jgi:CelD/BcsL family acetyltransferase involved in cellulose biosynthesis
MLRPVTTPSLSAGDPACLDPGPDPATLTDGSATSGPATGDKSAALPDPGRTLVASRRAFGSIPPEVWDALVDRTAAASPFSRHCVQRAWWDAYGATAHDETLVVSDPAAPGEIVGIAPLMHRHELEPGDLAARTSIRHRAGFALAPVPDSATAVFFGASYHADYATVLAAPADLPAVCSAVASYLAGLDPSRWDVVDLRRLRAGDPATEALCAAFEALSETAGWCVAREQEDVCPVLTLPTGRDFEGYLDTLDKKDRHETRRKIRRAESAGPIELIRSDNAPGDLEAFIDLHQKRWGEDGLFPASEGGAASRRFFAALVEDCAPAGYVELDFLSVGGRRIAAGVILDDGCSVYYYNAGVDPDARELSPGVLMVAAYIGRAIEMGRPRLDFMRGNEPYKYSWGAVDEPISRLLVWRTAGSGMDGSSPDRSLGR